MLQVLPHQASHGHGSGVPEELARLLRVRHPEGVAGNARQGVRPGETTSSASYSFSSVVQYS